MRAPPFTGLQPRRSLRRSGQDIPLDRDEPSGPGAYPEPDSKMGTKMPRHVRGAPLFGRRISRPTRRRSGSCDEYSFSRLYGSLWTYNLYSSVGPSSSVDGLCYSADITLSRGAETPCVRVPSRGPICSGKKRGRDIDHHAQVTYTVYCSIVRIRA